MKKQTWHAVYSESVNDGQDTILWLKYLIYIFLLTISGLNEKATVCVLTTDAFIMYVRRAFIVYQINLNKNNVQCINPLFCYRKDSFKMWTQPIFIS